MIVVGFDAIHANVGKLPKGSQAAGYTTGSPNIVWTNADWGRFPGAVRICQDSGATDTTADVLDVETGAATPGDCPGWARRAMANFGTAVRPGQRAPTIYTSASNVTNVANALVNGGVSDGVGLWVANWNLTESQAIADVQAASGPFPVTGIQYSNGQWYDYDVFATHWLANTSGQASAAQNPVRGLTVTHRGFTSVTLAWDAQGPATTGYTVKVFHRTEMVSDQDITGHGIRLRNLHMSTTYLIRIRAHPGGSTGSDAEIKVTTRPA